MAFLLILKYSILYIKILKVNVENFTILAIIHFVLTFNLNNEIKEISKLGLVYCSYQKSLLLFDLDLHEFYNSKSDNISVISEIETKNLLIIFFLQLIPNIHIINSFCIILTYSFDS